MSAEWRRVSTALALACVVFAAPRGSFGSGLSSPSVGTSQSGPAVVDAAAVYWNPANLAFVEEPSFLGGASLILGHLRYTRERRATYQLEDSFDFSLPVSADVVDDSKTGTAEPSTATPVGAAPTLFFATPVGDQWGLGVGLYAPYAAIVDFQEDGAQRWALRDATITVAQLSGAVAWRPLDRLSIGVGGSLAFGFAELSKSLDLAGLDNLGTALRHPSIDQENDFGADAPPAVRELNVTSRDFALRRATGVSGTFHVGITADAVPGVRLSAVYQHSLPLTMRGVFELDMNDEFFTQDLESQGLVYPALVSGDASLSFTLPSHVRGGLSWTPNDRVTTGINAALVRWSSIDTFDARVDSQDLAQPELGLPSTEAVSLPRNWHAAGEIEAFADWARSDRHRFWAVAGFHGGAAPDATMDASSPDGRRIVLAIGNSIRVSRRMSLIVDGELHTLIPRVVRSSDYDLGNGEYRLTLASLGLYADLRL